MCGKYVLLVGFLTVEMGNLIEICNKRAEDDGQISLARQGEISPGDCAPALIVEKCRATAHAMRWGFERPGGGLVINARSEDVLKRPMFRSLIDRQRCVLPASGYFEWRDSDHVRHLIRQDGGEPFYLAGLYRRDDQGKLRFVVLTRAAFGAHARIHGRMPCVLFSREEARRWIDGRMPPEAFSQQDPKHLAIEVQGPEQMRMDFLNWEELQDTNPDR